VGKFRLIQHHHIALNVRREVIVQLAMHHQLLVKQASTKTNKILQNVKLATLASLRILLEQQLAKRVQQVMLVVIAHISL
jgi:hypothetical protein